MKTVEQSLPLFETVIPKLLMTTVQTTLFCNFQHMYTNTNSIEEMSFKSFNTLKTLPVVAYLNTVS